MKNWLKENWFRIAIIILWLATLVTLTNLLTSGEVKIKNKQFEPSGLLPSLGGERF